MAMISRGRKKRLVLDIGSSAVRLCELSQTKNGYQLTKFVQREYDSDPSMDEEARRRLRINATQEVLKAAKAGRKKAITGVPGQSVFTRTRTLPPVPEYKVTQIVRYEIQQQIPFSLDQIAMDYQILDGTAATGYEVMMAAIKTDVVDKHLTVIEKAKRGVEVVDVCSIAAYNWLKHTGEFGASGQCIALIDMGATTTDIVIEREGRFRFTRPLNFGGNELTRAIAAEFGMNFQDAERAKRERAFAPTGDPQLDGKSGEVTGRVLQRFVSETVRSFAYFRSLPGGGQVHRVILTGGGACLRNIVPYLQKQFGMDVRIAQPIAGLAIAPGAQQVNERPEQACVVLGLALRCNETVPIEINLIPPRITELARQKEQAFYWALSLATLALIMASIIPMRAQENVVDLQHYDNMKRYIAEFDPEMAQLIKKGQPLPQSKRKQELGEMQARVNGLKSNVDVLDAVRDGRTFWLDELSIVNEARPKGVNIWFSVIETAKIRQGDGQGGPGGPGGPPQLPGAAGAAAPAVGGFQLGGQVGNVRAGGGRGGGVGQRAGFRGLTADQWGDAGGRGGGGGGRGRGGLPGGPGAQQKGPRELSIEPLNGLRIHGYAENDQIIKDFIQRLKEGQRVAPSRERVAASRVSWDEKSVQRVAWSTLYNAPEDGGGGVNQEDPYYLYSFTVEVQFDRGQDVLTAAEKERNQAAGGGAAGAGGVPGAVAPGGAPQAAPAANVSMLPGLQGAQNQ
jgi:type IV pilus assembly protein PilM